MSRHTTKAIAMTRTPLLLLALSGCFVATSRTDDSGDGTGTASGEVSDPPVTVAWANAADAGCLDLEITTETSLDHWTLTLQFASPPDALTSSDGVSADLSGGEVVLTPETNGFLSDSGKVAGKICLSPRSGPTDLTADVTASSAGSFTTLRDSGEVLGLVSRAGAGGCVDLEVVNLTDTDITGWQMVVHLDAAAVLTSASGDGIRGFVGDTTSELDLYPTASTNKLKAFDSALGQVCLSPSAVPDHITTSWEIGP